MKTTAKQEDDFTYEVFGQNLLESTINHITSNYSPEEIFGKDSMVEWAEENGYVKEQA